MNARPGRSDGSMRTGASTEPRREETRDDLAVRQLQPLGVLRREVERLAAVQRRAVEVRLGARVVGLEPAAGGEPDRVVGVERLERALRLDDGERRRRPAEGVSQSRLVQELRPGMLLVQARPLQAAVLLEPGVAHPGVHRRERAELVPHVLGDRVGPVVPEPARELGEDPHVVARLAGRIECLAHALHATLAVRHRPLALAPRRGRGEDDVGHLGGLREHDVLDDEEVEARRGACGRG